MLAQFKFDKNDTFHKTEKYISNSHYLFTLEYLDAYVRQNNKSDKLSREFKKILALPQGKSCNGEILSKDCFKLDTIIPSLDGYNKHVTAYPTSARLDAKNKLMITSLVFPIIEDEKQVVLIGPKYAQLITSTNCKVVFKASLLPCIFLDENKNIVGLLMPCRE